MQKGQQTLTFLIVSLFAELRSYGCIADPLGSHLLV